MDLSQEEEDLRNQCPFEAFGIVPKDRGDIWVFGYGSLMWNPGFEYEEAVPGILHGYHRSFCVKAYHYRGTAEQPGLVLGLDRGGCCHGVLFRVHPNQIDDAMHYLWQREMITAIYKPKCVQVRKLLGAADDSQISQACTFVVNAKHKQYMADRDPEVVASVIARAEGSRGPNADYLFNTLEHLKAIGIRDQAMEDIAERVRVML